MNIKTLLVTLCLFTAVAASAAPPVEEGKSIFTTRCASCHNVNKVLTGPALAGVDERRSMDWIISFVKSSQTLVKNGDKTAVELFEQFNKIPMPDHPDLTDDNIKSIVEYIKSEGSAQTAKAPFAKPTKKRPNYAPITLQDTGIIISFLAVISLLIMSLLLLVYVKKLQRATLNKADK